MADPMEMSLDDIIKTNRQGRGRRGRRGGAGGQQQQGGANNKSPFKQGGRGRPFRRGSGRGAASGQPRGGGAGAAAAVPSNGHIIISNLDFQVSDGDLNELFGEFGQIKKARVHFDASGKSQGSADVVFARYQDAIRALNKYNGVPLDGREMRIMIASTASQMVSPTRQYSPGRGGRGGQQRSGYSGRSNAATRGSGGGRGGGRFQRRGGRGGGSGRGGQAPRSMTKEQLDAEIDAYHTEAQPMEA